MASVVGAALAAQNGALAGKRAVVVGGTNGIGRGIALNLAAKGADVVVVGRKDRGILDDLEKARAGGAYRFEAADCFLLSEARRCVDPDASFLPPEFKSNATDLETILRVWGQSRDLNQRPRNNPHTFPSHSNTYLPVSPNKP